MYEELLAKINQLKRSGGVGYTEGGKKTITRKSEDLVTIFGDIQAEKVSDVPVDLNTVENMHLQIDGSVLDVQKSELFVTGDVGIQFIALAGDEMPPYIFSVFDDMPDMANKGVYFPVYENENNGINCCMSFAYNEETVHTIDPKYLPAGSGGGLPVVELESLPAPGGTVSLSEKETEQVKEALRTSDWCIITFPTVYSHYLARRVPNADVYAARIPLDASGATAWFILIVGTEDGTDYSSMLQMV